MTDLTLHLPDAGATLAVGAELARILVRERQVGCLFLRGGLGAGKTTLVRGLVLSLPGGEEAEVASPSFTIVNQYGTIPPVMHADLFRCPPGLGVPDEIEDCLDPYAASGSLVCVEWPEHLPEALVPPKRLDILLEPCQGSRRFSAAGQGEEAARVCRRLTAWAQASHPDWLVRPGQDRA